jgi:hypothetical protein
MAPTTPLEDLIGALKAHAIAAAELVGTYDYDPGERPPAQPSERSFAGRPGESSAIRT